tara:strand:+ start:149113 stop:149241 length:129 start_codon:yes stop_codon:yes gene_type:complete
MGDVLATIVGWAAALAAPFLLFLFAEIGARISELRGKKQHLS